MGGIFNFMVAGYQELIENLNYYYLCMYVCINKEFERERERERGREREREPVLYHTCISFFIGAMCSA